MGAGPFRVLSPAGLTRFEFGRSVPPPARPECGRPAEAPVPGCLSGLVRANTPGAEPRTPGSEQVLGPAPGEPRRGAVPAGRRQMVSAALAGGPRGEGSDGPETLSSSD